METLTKTKWSIDKAHSEIAFKVKHMMISTLTGHFEDFDAHIDSDTDDFISASIYFSAKTNSINTSNQNRDAHLKSDDFFNVEKYPELTFQSKSFDGETLMGNLTIRDVTKEISLSVDTNGTAIDPYGQLKAGFEIEGSINRKDFNLTWSAVTEAGSIVVGDTVKISISVQFTKHK